MLKTDNQSVFYIINKAGSHIPKLHVLFKDVWWYCFRQGICITATWIPREQNQWADFYSKLIESSDIKLNPAIFDALQRMWGVFDIDLFASYNNFQIKKYYSFYWTPTTHGVDAFNYTWGRQCYCNPPYKLIGNVIEHARSSSARMCLIIPCWYQAGWWNKITDDGNWLATWIRDYRVLPRTRDLQSKGCPGSKVQREYSKTAPIWDTLALLIDFSPWAGTRLKMPFKDDKSTRYL